MGVIYFCTGASVRNFTQQSDNLSQKNQQENSDNVDWKEALLNAVREGDFNKTEAIIQDHAYEIEDLEEPFPLHEAIEKGFIKIVKLLVDNGIYVNQKNENGSTPLHIAALKGFTIIGKYLIDNGADRELTDNTGSTAFHIAAENGYIHIVKLLLNDYIDINKKNNDGESAFSLAFQNGHYAIAKLLKQHHKFEADPNVIGIEALDDPKPEPSEIGAFAIVFNTPPEELEEAIQSGNLEGVQPPAIIPVHEMVVMNEKFPLHAAAEKGFLNIAHTICNFGADVNGLNDNGSAAIHVAVEKNDDLMVELFIEFDADINLQNQLGQTPLHIASENGFDNITFILLDEGARRDLKDKNGNLAYDLALKGGHQEVIELFEAAAHGENLDDAEEGSVDTSKTSIGSDETVAELSDIDENATEHWERELENAIRTGNVKGAETLILAYSSRLKEITESFPLHEAAERGYRSVIKLLVENGLKTEINRPNNDEDRPIHLAARNGHVNVIGFLIAKGALVNVVNIHGNTPLHEAARSGNQNSVKVLIHFGADVNHANQLGETALHIATEHAHEEIVKILVNKGAKIDVKNNTGSIPVVVALRKGHKNIATFLAKQYKSKAKN